MNLGGARITVEWGYDGHEVVLTPRNWARVKRGGNLRIRSRGFSEEGFQWEYWNFAGGLDGDLIVFLVSAYETDQVIEQRRVLVSS